MKREKVYMKVIPGPPRLLAATEQMLQLSWWRWNPKFPMQAVFELDPPALCEVETSHTQNTQRWFTTEAISKNFWKVCQKMRCWKSKPGYCTTVTIKLDRTWELNPGLGSASFACTRLLGRLCLVQVFIHILDLLEMCLDLFLLVVCVPADTSNQAALRLIFGEPQRVKHPAWSYKTSKWWTEFGPTTWYSDRVISAIQLSA